MSLEVRNESNNSKSACEDSEISMEATAEPQSAKLPLFNVAIKVVCVVVAIELAWNEWPEVEVIRALTSWWLTNSVLKWGSSFEMNE